MSEWQPIETCPYYKVVELWIPEHDGWPWASMAWNGMKRGGDHGDSRNYPQPDSFIVYTPYRAPDRRGVVCPVTKIPGGWRKLSEPPK